MTDYQFTIIVSILVSIAVELAYLIWIAINFTSNFEVIQEEE